MSRSMSRSENGNGAMFGISLGIDRMGAVCYVAAVSEPRHDAHPKESERPKEL